MKLQRFALFMTAFVIHYLCGPALAMGVNVVVKTGKELAQAAADTKALAGAKVGALIDLEGPVYWGTLSARIASRAAQCAAQSRPESGCKHWKEETEQCFRAYEAGLHGAKGKGDEPQLLKNAEICDRDYPSVNEMALFPDSAELNQISWRRVGDRLHAAKNDCKTKGLSPERCQLWSERVKTCLIISYPRAIDYSSEQNDTQLIKAVSRCDRPLPWVY